MRRVLLIGALLACVGCTKITILFPICERTTIYWQTGQVEVDTLAVPDSLCIEEFKRQHVRK